MISINESFFLNIPIFLIAPADFFISAVDMFIHLINIDGTITETALHGDFDLENFSAKILPPLLFPKIFV